MTPLLILLAKKKKKSSNGFYTFQKAATSFPPPSHPSEGGNLPSASPPLSSNFPKGRPRAAGGPQRLFVSLFTSRRAPESLFTDCSNPPLFSRSSPGHFHRLGAKVAPMLSSLPSISGVGGGNRNFLHLTRFVFRRPIPTQMMNTTPFQISHPLCAAVAKLARQKIINTGGRE